MQENCSPYPRAKARGLAARSMVKIKHHEQHKETLYVTPASFKNDYPFLKDASVLCEIKHPESLPVTDKVVGIDLGLHDFMVCSDGERVEAPKHFRKSEQRLARIQRAFLEPRKEAMDMKKHVWKSPDVIRK